MRLLILTQKVDLNDDVLGFFHGWIKELSKKYSSIIVIALEVNNYDLPENVEVLSLGKENGRSKIKYIINFYKYIWNKKSNYDSVLVHMNAEYMALGGLLWKLWGKRTSLWYNHSHGSVWARISTYISDNIFYTSPFAFMAKFRKSVKMPVGINTDLFKLNENISKKDNSLLFLSRISPVKKLKELIEALLILDQDNIDFKLTIAGEASEGSENYFNKIKVLSKDLEMKGKVQYIGSVPNYETPSLYNEHEIFINLTESGSFDKTIVESMSSGTLVLVLNESLKDFLPKDFIFSDSSPQVISDVIKKALSMDSDSGKNHISKNRAYVESGHSLKKLTNSLYGLL